MDGFRVFMNCVCMCIFAAGPMRIGDFALLGNQNMGGGVPVATLVHGDPAPAVIASAYRSTVDFLPLDIVHSNAPCPNTVDGEISSSTTSAMVKPAASLSTSWRWQATLAPDATRDDWKFGAAVSIYERTIAVGPARDWDIGVDQGGVQLYTCIGEKWMESAGFLHPTGDTHAHFGACVALRNHMLLVGAPRDSAMAFESGAAFLYEQVDDQWQLNATRVRSTANDADQFGAAVACDENTLVILAYPKLIKVRLIRAWWKFLNATRTGGTMLPRWFQILQLRARCLDFLSRLRLETLLLARRAIEPMAQCRVVHFFLHVAPMVGRWTHHFPVQSEFVVGLAHPSPFIKIAF